MGYRTNALVLAFFCLLAVFTLLTTAANAVAKEEDHVAVDAKKGLRKVLNEKIVESVGKATNDQNIPSLEDEKSYGDGGYSNGGYGNGGYGNGRHGHWGHGGQGHGGYGYGNPGGHHHGGYGCVHC